MRYEQFTVGQIIRGGVNNGLVTVLEIDDSGLISECKCVTGSIPSATAGYIVGCKLTDTTTGKPYYNSGTTSSCTFNAVSDITSAELADSIDLGASGAAGDLDIFPTTASKGKLSISAADSAGDTTTTITNASQAGARTYTVPDAGASASFVMTEGAQTVNGVKTLGSAPVMSGASITAATIPSASLVAYAGLAAMVTAGLGNSASYIRTDVGTKTLLAANATKDRGVLVVVYIDTTFADGDGTQPTLQVGETDTVNKAWDTATFVGATAGSYFVKGFLNTSTKAIIATEVAATGATSTGAYTITVLALPNS